MRIGYGRILGMMEYVTWIQLVEGIKINRSSVIIEGVVGKLAHTCIFHG